MRWVGSCGQFALISPGTHSMTWWPSSSPASFPTYSIFPGKRKPSSSRHRNVASSVFRFGGRAILPPRCTWSCSAGNSMHRVPWNMNSPKFGGPGPAPVSGGVSSLGVRKVRWGCRRGPQAGSACRLCRRRSRCGSAPACRATPRPRWGDRQPQVGCGSSRLAQDCARRAWVGPLRRHRARSAGGAARLARGPRNRGVKLDTEAEPLGIERDRRVDVMDYVTHTDRGHLWSSSDLVGCVLCTWWHGEGLGTSCESTVFCLSLRTASCVCARWAPEGLHTRGSGDLVDSSPVIVGSRSL